MKKSFKMKNVLTSKMVTMAFGAHKLQKLCFDMQWFSLSFTIKYFHALWKNENVYFFCCELCCQCKEKEPR
jgi:hypothetical protein